MSTSATIFTIGYGGRAPDEFVRTLLEAQVPHVVDVRLRPDRSSMGAYAVAKDPHKGLAGLLGRSGIRHTSLIELGNVFLDAPDWLGRYERLLESSGDLLLERLLAIDPPYALLCAEKRPEECHRRVIARALTRRRPGWRVVDL